MDLPGFGESANMPEESNTVEFMKNLINELDIFKNRKIILVSPSMSGRFSLPYLMSGEAKIEGYIPIAPLGTTLGAERFTNINEYKGSYKIVI